MITVQLDDVYQILVGSDVLTVIIRQESLRDVVDRTNKGYNGELLFLLGQGPLPQ